MSDGKSRYVVEIDETQQYITIKTEDEKIVWDEKEYNNIWLGNTSQKYGDRTDILVDVKGNQRHLITGTNILTFSKSKSKITEFYSFWNYGERPETFWVDSNGHYFALALNGKLYEFFGNEEFEDTMEKQSSIEQYSILMDTIFEDKSIFENPPKFKIIKTRKTSKPKRKSSSKSKSRKNSRSRSRSQSKKTKRRTNSKSKSRSRSQSKKPKSKSKSQKTRSRSRSRSKKPKRKTNSRSQSKKPKRNQRRTPRTARKTTNRRRK